jgi:hypothetical protein
MKGLARMTKGFMEHVERFIPPGFWILLGEDFEQDYPLAVDHCMERFAAPEAHDLIGDERRARTETSLVDNATRFAHRGMKISAKTNVTGSHYHREVTAGPIVLTESFADSPKALVQPAIFRDTLARSPQISFLDEEEEPEGDLLYGMVLHGVRRVGRRQRRHDEFGFMYLGIPNKDCTKYLALYNIAKRYADHEVDPNDIATMMERGVPIEPQRRPSSVFEQYRRRGTDGL